jgi:hypothetical protein
MAVYPRRYNSLHQNDLYVGFIFGAKDKNTSIKKVKGKYIPVYRPWRPIGLQEVKAPTLLRQTANRWRQGCQPYAPAALYPQVSLFLKIPGTHFC